MQNDPSKALFVKPSSNQKYHLKKKTISEIHQDLLDSQIQKAIGKKK